MFKKILLIFFIIMGVNVSGFAGVFDNPKKLEEIAPNLPEFSSIKCKFEQEKTMPNSQMVLKSSGDFEFIKGEGIIFKTTFPIESTTSYNSTEYKQINDIVNAISNKNYGKIEAVFDFYFDKVGDKWTLGLVPKKSKQVAKYLKSIEIEGINDISKMKITTQNSVVTLIKFF